MLIHQVEYLIGLLSKPQPMTFWDILPMTLVVFAAGLVTGISVGEDLQKGEV